MVKKKSKRKINLYRCSTNGIQGQHMYEAFNPDEALHLCKFNEIFLRLLDSNPELSAPQASAIAIQEVDNYDSELDMPDFFIFNCTEVATK